MIAQSGFDKQTIVVIGHGMVGHRFCEKMIQYDADRRFRIVTFCEEPGGLRPGRPDLFLRQPQCAEIDARESRLVS